MAERLPPPKNKAIEVIKTVLEKLIEGVGVELAVSAGTAAWPFLATPVIRQLFKWLVQLLAQALDENLFKLAMKMIIRVQSSVRKDEFNEALKPIIEGNPSDEDIKRAREAADRLIERNRP